MSSKNKKSDASVASGSGRKPRFPELPPKYSSSRELRNKAEKMRRDRLNKLIEEMRSLVPMISTRTKKSDTTRSSILRLTANFLRVTRLFPNDANAGETQNSGNSFLGEGLPHLESMDGFFFILAEDGRVLYVSENIDKFIGFSQIEMMGFPIYNFTHPADQSKLQSNLSKKANHSPCPSPGNSLQSSSPPQVPASPSSSHSHTLAVPSIYHSNTEERGPRQSFYIRLREKPLAKHDKPQYEHMHVVGHLRKTDDDEKNNSVGQYTFIGVMRPVRDRPITELSLTESIQDQYLTRHLPDGRIIYTDHRISTIAGYLPSEVKGKSAFNFFCAEDLPWTTMAMRHMFASSNGEGSTVYRLTTQTGELICLQTKGFLEFNKTTNKIESFLCINTVIRPEDTERYLNEQKERFTPFITEVQINSMAASNQSIGLALSSSMTSSSTALPLLTQDSENPSSSFLQLLSSPSEVSVISKLSTNGSPPSMKSPGTGNPLKRSYTQVSPGYQEEYPFKEGPHVKKGFPSELISNKHLSRKRKLEDSGTEQRERQGASFSQNWQYIPARVEPVHRTEDGVRVVDIEEQFFPGDHPNTSGYKQEQNALDIQGLMNQMNKVHETSSNSGFLSENPSQQVSFDPQLNVTRSEMTTNGTPGPRRVGSVIRMLPQRQKTVQESSMSLERNNDHKSLLPLHNPLDKDGFLADFLSPHTVNHPTKNSIPRESEIIKEELTKSSSSEAERIAEKLKAMLAPLSGHHNRQDMSNSRTQEKICTQTSGLPGMDFPNHQNPLISEPDGSDLFEILDRDLIFSLDGTHNDPKLVSNLKDEVPSTSS